ncbi:hypothetical protein AA637_09475 [Cyanobacterium sp. HL-69]|nr:hypothetical protein AA637_09475 [Cyanobacterium sp. HL-69]
MNQEFLCLRHLSEQYFTSSQDFSHFLRHVKDKPHTGQTFVGKSDFFLCLVIKYIIFLTI